MMDTVRKREKKQQDKEVVKEARHRIDTLQFRWTTEEHDAFIEGVNEFGKDYGKISTKIPTKTRKQIKNHAF